MIRPLLALLLLASPAWADRLCDPSRTRPDGDTFYLSAPVRLYGVDAPERGQPLWEEALTHARTIMGDRKLETLCGDHSYGRRVCRVLVEVDGQTLDLGLELVRSGLAYPAMRGGDPLYRDALDAAAKEAEAAGVGVWALPDGGVRPWEYRRR